jgi:hypothetical protein
VQGRSVIFDLIENVLTPDQRGKLGLKRQVHDVRNHIHAAAWLDIRSDDQELARVFPKRRQRSFRRKD